MKLLPLLSVLVAAAACSPGDDVVVDPTDGPTWHHDVKPIVDQSCVRCHSEGGSGTGDFTDRATFEALAEVALTRIDDEVMPPPAADPACRDYVSSEHMTLPDGARDTLDAWIDAGMPQGDPSDGVEVDLVVPELPDPDLVVRLPTPYTPTFSDPRNPGNEYRCFYVETGMDEAFFITALHPIVDEPRLVHHVVLATIDASQVPSSYDPALGEDCIDGARFDINQGMLGGWAPGMVPVELPGTGGIKVDKGKLLVIQMHYYQNGATGLSDQSGYAFKIASSASPRIYMIPLGNYDFRIPAGAEAYTSSESLPLNFGVDLTVYGTFPHMHVLGSAYRGWVDHPDGSTTCLVEGRYDFNNQLTYLFRERMVVHDGDTLNFECTWNNSTSNPNLIHDPPIDTRYGERTDEEMCFAFTLAAIGAW